MLYIQFRDEEVSEILIPGSEEQEKDGEEEEQLRQESRDATQLPRSSARAWPGAMKIWCA